MKSSTRTSTDPQLIVQHAEHGEDEVCIECLQAEADEARTASVNHGLSKFHVDDGHFHVDDGQTGESSASAGIGTYGEGIEPPTMQSLRPSVLIEYCDRCRWAPRATWIQTELLLTFPVPTINSITLQPLTSPDTGGRFRVWVNDGQKDTLVWDRKTEGGFPELKVLKQKIRNILQPDRSLGHSDFKPV